MTEKGPIIYFVGAGPGDPELITVKGKKLLEAADVIVYAGSLVNPALLKGLKAASYDSARMNLDEIVDVMRKAVEAGRMVVRLHTGDTAFYSAISEQIERLSGLSIACRVIPGVSSAMAGAAILGQELTIPEISQTVIFTRLGGVPPCRKRGACRPLPAQGIDGHIPERRDDRKGGGRAAEGYPGKTPAVVIEKASWPEQKVMRGSLKDIAALARADGVEKTALIYVGDALWASLESLGKESRLYYKAFRHGYRK